MAVYNIQNSYLCIEVSASGAELISLKNSKGKELLWQADKSVWPRHAPVLFPIVGRLKNNKYLYNNTSYELSQHGFARDKEFNLISKTETSLCFELKSDESTIQCYPFEFALQITFSLKNNIINTKYKLTNSSNHQMYFGIGAHPGFSTQIAQGETLSDYKILFSNKHELTAEKLADGLLSGESYKINLPNGELPLSAEVFNNDALVFKNTQIESLVLYSEKSGNKIKMNCSGWPFFGIWSKKDCNQFICLEPWYGITDASDASGKFSEKLGINCLEAMQSRQFEFAIEVN